MWAETDDTARPDISLMPVLVRAICTECEELVLTILTTPDCAGLHYVGSEYIEKMAFDIINGCIYPSVGFEFIFLCPDLTHKQCVSGY